MGYSDQDIGRQAAQQGLGMPGNASIATQNAYNDERARMNAARSGGFKLPGPPVDVGGIAFLLLLPIIALWYVVMDLLTGWRWWRVLALLLSLAVAAGAFVLAVKEGVQFELANPSASEAEVEAAAESMLVVGAGGACGVILCLFPRTIGVLVLVVGAIELWNKVLGPALGL